MTPAHALILGRLQLGWRAVGLLRLVVPASNGVRQIRRRGRWRRQQQRHHQRRWSQQCCRQHHQRHQAFAFRPSCVASAHVQPAGDSVAPQCAQQQRQTQQRQEQRQDHTPPGNRFSATTTTAIENVDMTTSVSVVICVRALVCLRSCVCARVRAGVRARANVIGGARTCGVGAAAFDPTRSVRVSQCYLQYYYCENNATTHTHTCLTHWCSQHAS